MNELLDIVYKLLQELQYRYRVFIVGLQIY